VKEIVKIDDKMEKCMIISLRKNEEEFDKMSEDY
jgi:hypothetical protein